MSIVTNAILSFSIADDRKTSAELNEWEGFHGKTGFVSCNDQSLPTGWYGGTKMLETPLYIGAINYFYPLQYLAYLAGLTWKEPHHVQLIIKEQEEDSFIILTFASLDDSPR